MASTRTSALSDRVLLLLAFSVHYFWQYATKSCNSHKHSNHKLCTNKIKNKHNRKKPITATLVDQTNHNHKQSSPSYKRCKECERCKLFQEFTGKTIILTPYMTIVTYSPNLFNRFKLSLLVDNCCAKSGAKG